MSPPDRSARSATPALTHLLPAQLIKNSIYSVAVGSLIVGALLKGDIVLTLSYPAACVGAAIVLASIICYAYASRLNMYETISLFIIKAVSRGALSTAALVSGAVVNTLCDPSFHEFLAKRAPASFQDLDRLHSEIQTALNTDSDATPALALAALDLLSRASLFVVVQVGVWNFFPWTKLSVPVRVVCLAGFILSAVAHYIMYLEALIFCELMGLQQYSSTGSSRFHSAFTYVVIASSLVSMLSGKRWMRSVLYRLSAATICVLAAGIMDGTIQSIHDSALFEDRPMRFHADCVLSFPRALVPGGLVFLCVDWLQPITSSGCIGYLVWLLYFVY